MKTNFPERIIEMLRGSSNGLTSKDIAERPGTTAGNISSRLGKLAAYGVIGKARGTLVGHCSRGTVYQAPIHEPRHGNGPPTGSNESAGADAKKPFAVLDKAVSDRADPGNR